MTDIVTRLRAQAHDRGMFELCVDGATADEAADEIEQARRGIEIYLAEITQQRDEIERLTAALEEYGDQKYAAGMRRARRNP